MSLSFYFFIFLFEGKRIQQIWHTAPPGNNLNQHPELLPMCFQLRNALAVKKIRCLDSALRKSVSFETDFPTISYSIIPKGLTYSATWCGSEQAHLKIINQTTPNELHRHRHISSLLLDWCVRATRLHWSP